MKRNDEVKRKDNISQEERMSNHMSKFGVATLIGMVVIPLFFSPDSMAASENINEVRSDTMEYSHGIVIEGQDYSYPVVGIESIMNMVQEEEGDSYLADVIEFRDDIALKDNIIRYVRGYDSSQGLDSASWYITSVSRDIRKPSEERVEHKKLFDANDKTDKFMNTIS